MQNLVAIGLGVSGTVRGQISPFSIELHWLTLSSLKHMALPLPWLCDIDVIKHSDIMLKLKLLTICA